MRARLLLLGLVALAAGCGAVLGIDKDYVEGVLDASTAPDGTIAEGGSDSAADTSTLDGGDTDGAIDAGPDGGCAGHICQGVCLSGTSCEGCAEGALLCSATRTCVSACGACGTGAVECWKCPGVSPIGSCEPGATAFCFGAAYAHCPCVGDAGAALCPGATQTCRSNVCKTCGETNTDGAKCKNATDCTENTKQCR